MARDSRLMREFGGMVLDQVRSVLVQRAARDSLSARTNANLTDSDEPPVVAQLMIEIRSDGSRTIARGALHDLRNNESAQVHAAGRTPRELMLSLAGSLLTLSGNLFDATRTKLNPPLKCDDSQRDEQPDQALASDAPFPPEKP